MSSLIPSAQEFLSKAEEVFRFLVAEHGFTRALPTARPSSQPFQARYESEATAVVIEGQSWGSAATVSIGKKDADPGGDFELVPLWTIARLKGPEYEAALQVPGQLAQLEANAVFLHRHCQASLRGNPSEVEAARQYLQERVRKATGG